MTPTVFAALLQSAVDRVPGAVGGAFAAADGEMVDFCTEAQPTEWAILTAHFGILFQQVRSALHTFHFGDAETLVVCHEAMTILLRAVDRDYFALLGIAPAGGLARGLLELERVSGELRRELA